MEQDQEPEEELGKFEMAKEEESEQPPGEILPEEAEIDSLTEIEKNLNYIWDKSHNLFKFSSKGKSWAEMMIDHKTAVKKRDYYTAAMIGEEFMFQFQMAIRDDENNKLVMKEIFNTLKAMQRKK